MTGYLYSRSVIVLTFVAIFSSGARGSLFEFTEKAEWETAVGAYSTITFTEFPAATQITTDYDELGITFHTLNFVLNSSAFVNDLWGLHGPDGVRFTFDSPQSWVAIDHPGVAQFELLLHGEVVATSDLFPASGTGNFSGVVSSVSFDEVVIFKPRPFTNVVAIDDLHWGAIPAPGALWLLCFGALPRRGRSRL